MQIFEKAWKLGIPVLACDFYGLGTYKLAYMGQPPYYECGRMGAEDFMKFYPDKNGAFIVLSRNSLITFTRLLSGTLFRIFAGISIAILIWWDEVIRRFIEPLVLTFRNVPPLALLPLFMIWFGGWEICNILFIAFPVGVMIVINSVTAMRNLNVEKRLGSYKILK